jgi:hypothetical protein
LGASRPRAQSGTSIAALKLLLKSQLFLLMARRKGYMSPAARKAEIARIRKILSSSTLRFTAKEIASLKGRLGGLLGKGKPSRVYAGKRGAEVKYGKKYL